VKRSSGERIIAVGDRTSSFGMETVMHHLFSPVLADYIWIGGGTLGAILVIVIIVVLLRK
jgi:hypothetical protein